MTAKTTRTYFSEKNKDGLMSYHEHLLKYEQHLMNNKKKIHHILDNMKDAIMNHQNKPVNRIKSYAKLIRNEYEPVLDDTEDVYENVRIISFSIKKMYKSDIIENTPIIKRILKKIMEIKLVYDEIDLLIQTMFEYYKNINKSNGGKRRTYRKHRK